MFKVYEYQWSAINRFEQKQKGKRLAKNQEELENLLLKKGYHHIKISRNFAFAKSPQSEEITQILSQLAMLVKAKIPLKSALAMILENCTQIKIYLWLEALIKWIELGYAFSTALEKSEKYIPQQEIQLIKMGEISGKLETILQNIAKARKEKETTLKKVKKILFYPIVVLTISFSLSIGLLLFIVPQFAELYGAKEKSLPMITEILFSLSAFLQEYINEFIFFFIVIMLFFRFIAKKTAWFLHVKNRLLKATPVFNQIFNYARIVFFHQNLALMLNANIRLDAILRSFLSETPDDPQLQQEITTALQLLKQGYSLSESLNPNLFNEQVIQMLFIGEKSGNLAQMSEHIHEIYQQKLDYQIDIISQLLEPMLMLVMGIIVGTIIVGLYLPIFDMGSLVE